MIDIQKLKQAVDDNQAAGWPAMQIPVCHARELITRLEAAERDAARLDFLSTEMNRTVHYLTSKWYWSRKPYKTYMRKESIREAIDAAMKESK